MILNNYTNTGEMTIKNKSGVIFKVLFDPEDMEIVNSYRWYVKKDPGSPAYAISTKFVEGKRLCLHRLINNTPHGMYTDHINRNGLDNRRLNLRTVTIAENNKNRSNITVPKTSRFKGVSWEKSKELWRVSISHNKKTITPKPLRFESELEAALSYNKLAIKYGSTPLNVLTFKEYSLIKLRRKL